MDNREIANAFAEHRAKETGGPRFAEGDRPSDDEVRAYINDVHGGTVIVSKSGGKKHVPGPKGYALCNKIVRARQTDKLVDYYPNAEFCTECLARSFPERCRHDVTGPITDRNNENKTQSESNR